MMEQGSTPKGQLPRRRKSIIVRRNRSLLPIAPSVGILVINQLSSCIHKEIFRLRHAGLLNKIITNQLITNLLI